MIKVISKLSKLSKNVLTIFFLNDWDHPDFIFTINLSKYRDLIC